MNLLMCKLDSFSDHNRFSPHTLSNSLYHQPLRVSMLSAPLSKRSIAYLLPIHCCKKPPSAAHPYDAVGNRLSLTTGEGMVTSRDYSRLPIMSPG